MKYPDTETLEATEHVSLHEQMSALHDGQLSAAQAAALVRASLQDDSMMLQWRSACVIGDALRQSQYLAAVPLLPSVSFPASVLESSAAATPLPMPSTPAANDSLFRWKMVAGFAALAAVGSIVWGLLGSQAVSSGGAVLASNQATPQQQLIAVQASQDAPVMIRDPRLDELLAAHKQFGGASALNQPAGSLRSASLSVNRR